jgi:NAD(P)H-hydrate repair Nnr-like enzyme with NAD(P)H-hydrate epimerase domain
MGLEDGRVSGVGCGGYYPMTVQIPEEWRTAIEGQCRRSRLMDASTRAAIDAMILAYYPEKTQRQIAVVCGCSTGYIATRVLSLREEGKI